MAGKKVRNNAPFFTALDCLLLMAEQTDQGKKEHKLSVSLILSKETRLFTCSMSIRDKKITLQDIQADCARDAEDICAEKFLKLLFKQVENICSDVNKAISFLKDKRLIADKVKYVSNKKDGVFVNRAVEVKCDIFGHDLITFGSTGRATDKLLALALSEICILHQINEHFMLGPIVRCGRRSVLFEFSCKGCLKESLSPDLFFARFPEMRDNLIILPDGRAVCRICKQVDRSSLLASHHHTGVRRILHRLHYSIERNDEKLAVFVSQSISALLEEQEAIAKYISENKQFVLDSAIQTLRKEISDVKLELFGQSEEGIGQCYYVLKFSVSSELMKSQEQLLETISYSLYQATDSFRFVNEDFTDSYPHIKTSHIETGLDCVFYIRREQSIQLSRLLHECSQLSSEFKMLSTVFNFWSSYCQLDQADSGYLHQFIFPLMTIHFLQYGVSPPRFPNLHLDKFLSRDLIHVPDAPDAFDTQLKLLFERAKADMGTLPPIPLWKLWLLLLQFYWIDFNYFHKIALQLRCGGDGTLLPLVREELDKDYSRLFVANPLAERNNIAFSMKTHHAYIYYFQCFRHTLEFYHSNVEKDIPRHLIETAHMSSLCIDEPVEDSKGVIVTDGVIAVPSKSDSKSDSGSEWELQAREETGPSPPLALEYSLNISTNTQDASDSKPTQAQEISNVDSPDLTLTSSEGVSHADSSNLAITSDVDTSNLTVASTENASSSNLTVASSEGVSHADSSNLAITSDVDTSNLTVASTENASSSNLTVASSEDVSHVIEHSSEGDDSDTEEEEHFTAQLDSPEAEEGVIFSDDANLPSESIPEVLLSSIRYAIKPGGDNVISEIELTGEELKKHCSRDNFILVKFSPICGYCRDKGHTKSDCPKESLPPVLPVSPLPRDSVRELNEGLLQLINSHKMSTKESEQREELRIEIQTDVRDIIGRKFDLCLFGSSVNRFGSDDSDVDLCLVVPPEDAGDLDKNRLLKSIARALRGRKYCHRYTNISQIPAKVPIIRFDYQLTNKKYTCDISLSNLLALNNSRLLLTYASLDQRVQDLGLLVKHFGKVNELADASQGGLSSYAYILLTIHFLQRTDPPVIPVLQQLRPPGREESSLKVDMWECYFCEDLHAVKQIWKHKQNSKSLAELWLEFLCYCVSKFDWEKQVVTLRQLEPISKLEKMWTNRKIAIEDPFNLDHNLGTVLTFKNAIRLKKCLIESRAFYHQPNSARVYLKHLKFDYAHVVMRDTQPPPVRETRKTQPQLVPPKQPTPEEYPLNRPQPRDRPLLSWSNGLTKYCTREVHSQYGEFDIVQLSETVLIPSEIFSKKRDSAKPIPTQNKFLNGRNFSSSKNDRVILAGPHCHDYPILQTQLNGAIFPPNTTTLVAQPPPISATPPASIPLPVANSSPPIRSTSPVCESLSLSEMTQRVAQESRDLMPAQFQSSPLSTVIPHPLDYAQFPEIAKDSQTEQADKDSSEKSRSATKPSPDKRPTPSAQKQVFSPGYKTGRGGGRSPAVDGSQPLYSSKVEAGIRPIHQTRPSYSRLMRAPIAPYVSTNSHPHIQQGWNDPFPQLLPPDQGSYPIPVRMSHPRGGQPNRRGHRVITHGETYIYNRGDGGRGMRGRGPFVTHNQRNQRYK